MGSAVGSSKIAPQMQFGAKKAPAQAAFAYGLPGGDNVLGEFDPAGFMAGKSKLEVYRLREAELAHGRVSMLAAVGFLVQEQFRLAKGWAKLDPATNKAASALREGYYPGDLAFDPLNLKPEDPEEFRLMQEKELSHA